MTKRRALSRKEIEERYPISEGTLANLKSQGKGPPWYKLGGRVVYFVDEFEAWIRGEEAGESSEDN